MTKAGGRRRNLRWSTCLDYLFPGHCFLCGQSLLTLPSSEYPVCGDCIQRFRLIDEPLCRRCGRTLISERDICTGCRGREFSFESHKSLFEYEGSVKDLLMFFKFRNRRRAGRLVADMMARQLQQYHTGQPVVPVPSRKGKDHIYQICRYLSRGHGIQVHHCLFRKPGPPQKLLDYEERLANMKNRIGMKPGFLVPGSEAVVIDDIYTTGATVNECARCLVESGVEVVRALTFAMDLP